MYNNDSHISYINYLYNIASRKKTNVIHRMWCDTCGNCGVVLPRDYCYDDDVCEFCGCINCDEDNFENRKDFEMEIATCYV